VSQRVVADTAAISGDSVAADNLEKEYDGTGYGIVMQRTTIATLASQTEFTLTAGSADDNAYQRCIVVIEDASTPAQKAIGFVDDYVGSTKTVFLFPDPGIFTIAAGDIVTLIADPSVKPVLPNVQLTVAGSGNVTANIGTGGITSSTFTGNAINAAALAADAVTEIRSVANGTADSGSTTTMVDAALTQADTDYWKGLWILFTSGTISGQVRLITGFTPGTDTITFAPATTQAVGTNTYEILPSGAVDVRMVDGSAAAAARFGLMFSAARQIVVDDATFAPTTTVFETEQTTDEAAVYGEQVLFALDGGNAGMTVRITAYAFANSKVKLTVDALKVAPSDGHRFLMMGRIEQ